MTDEMDHSGFVDAAIGIEQHHLATGEGVDATLIERLRKLLADATPGPWRMEHGSISAHIHQVDGLYWLASTVIGHGDWHSPDQARGVRDARLIVEAVNALPALLDALTNAAAERAAAVAQERERCAGVAQASAASSVPLMKGLGVSACVETGRHRAATEIAAAIREGAGA